MSDVTAPVVDARRPLGVLIVAAVQVLRAASLVAQLIGFGAVLPFEWMRTAQQLPDAPPGTVAYYLIWLIGLGLIAASLASAFGLIANKRWGWIGGIALSGLSLAFTLGAWWDGHPAYAAMAINVVAVFYLNQRDIRAWYDESPDDEALAT